ncbi:hypothetical protein [Nocardia xishanensis]
MTEGLAALPTALGLVSPLVCAARVPEVLPNVAFRDLVHKCAICILVL